VLLAVAKLLVYEYSPKQVKLSNEVFSLKFDPLNDLNSRSATQQQRNENTRYDCSVAKK